MGSALRMYEGNLARQMKRDGNQPVWKQPMYDSRAGRSAGSSRRTQASVHRQAANTARRKKKRMRCRVVRWLALYFCLAGIVATAWVIVSFLFDGGEKADAGDIQGQIQGIDGRRPQQRRGRRRGRTILWRSHRKCDRSVRICTPGTKSSSLW